MPRAVPPRPAPRGSTIIVVLMLIVALSLVGVFLVRLAAGDRVEAARMGVRDRGVACAEAGLQYGRRFFGSRYDTSNNWNDYLAANSNFLYPTRPTVAAEPRVYGKSDGAAFDPGADLDGDGSPDFWVSVRDDDDERPLGRADDPNRDNNETLLLRSECINDAWAEEVGGTSRHAVLESMLTHVQGTSGYGTASRNSNAMDIVGGR